MTDEISDRGTPPNARPAYGTRQAAQTVLATSGLHTWAQQCLTFELNESVGVLGTGGKRAIRISSKGTVINAAQYRGEGMALAKDPLSRGVTGHLEWILDPATTGDTPYSNFVLEDFYFSLEVVTPNDSGIGACPSEEWYLSDISPTTKINDVSVSTSTSSGFNVGIMGDVPTAGYDESNSNARDWTLPDYALLAIAGHDVAGAPHGAWHIKRSDASTDPQIANSSLSPDLELVFTLRPDAPARRFTSIAANMTVSFQDTPTPSKKSESVDQTERLIKITEIFNPLLSPMVKLFTKQNGGDSEDIKVYSFIVNYVVDWHTGNVFTKIVNNASGSPIPASELIVISGKKSERRLLEEYAEDRKALDRGFPDASITATLAKNYLAAPIAVPKALEIPMIFDQGSMLGVAGALVGDSDGHLDMLFPAYCSGDTASAFRIYYGFLDQKEVDASSSSWLPFKNAVRIKAASELTKQLLWCAPAGSTRGKVVCLSIGDGGQGTSECIAVSSITALGSSHVPHGLHAIGNNNIILWLDHIYFYTDRYDKSNPVETWPACTGVLDKAAFSAGFSIGVSNGIPKFSKDFFKTTEQRSKYESIKLYSEDENIKTCDLYNEIYKIVSNSFRYSIFSVYDVILLFYDSHVFAVKVDNNEAAAVKTELEYLIDNNHEGLEKLHGHPQDIIYDNLLWHFQQLAIRFSRGSDITGTVLRGFGSIGYGGNSELLITER